MRILYITINDLCTRPIFGRVQWSFFQGDVIAIVRDLLCMMMSMNTQYDMNMYTQYGMNIYDNQHVCQSTNTQYAHVYVWQSTNTLPMHHV